MRTSFVLVATLLATAVAAAVAPAEAAEGRRGMVVSAQHEASAAGLRILQAGGNAIDAAAAVGYALAVVDPCCGNIGGGGFMLIHRAGAGDTAINFRETAPGAATRDMYLDPAGNPVRDASLYGFRAAGVPGTVMGLDRALARFGTMRREEIIAPAIALAQNGFVLGDGDAAIFARAAKRLAADPEAARLFLHADGSPYRAGERLVQSDLALTLARIAAEGPDGFYRGPVAAAVAKAAASAGGILTEADFAAYTAEEAEPLACRYRAYTIVSLRPPSAGGTTLCQILGIVSGWDASVGGFGSARTIHLSVEAMRRAYRERNTLLGDPAFVSNPVERLISAAHLDTLRATIDPDRATASSALGPTPRERPETTHYSVADGAGNAVAVTYTINGNFGAGTVAPGTGFLLNNEMDDFAVKPGAANLFGLVQGEANAIAPGKRPLSSMTPTLVERDGRPVYVLGSPGGPRITTAVLETLLNLIDYGMAPEAAVAAPRHHHQYLPDTIFYERLSPETVAALTAMGHTLKEQPPWGAVELIAIGPDGLLTGVNDPRRPAGAALGY